MGHNNRPTGTKSLSANSKSAANEARPNLGRPPRMIAVVGPYLSGKTTLLESILERTGAIAKAGDVTLGTAVGDASAEARTHHMSVEMNLADVLFLGDRFTFVDCPGSIEFHHEALETLSVCDAAIVVCEPDAKRVPALQVILKQLGDNGLPHFLFLNKIDEFDARVRDILKVLQPASARPLVLRQIPIWENGIATGFVDLALERAFIYREHAPSEVVAIPADVKDREHEARFSMLEQLADYDDKLMEQLLSDMEPPRDRVFDDLARELKSGKICPVLLGSAKNGNGIVRLLKALRHEVPFVTTTTERLGLSRGGALAKVIKTLHTPHGGKLSIARVLQGTIPDGTIMAGAKTEDRIASISSLRGEALLKRAVAEAGDTVALGRLEHMRTGDWLTSGGGQAPKLPPTDLPTPVYGIAVGLKDRKDEVKMSAALAKLQEEDAGLHVENNGQTHQMVLWGQGEMHLRVALERLARKFGVHVERGRRLVPYKETIRKPTTVRGRHKKQSGGHGQFGDVVVEIAPRARGAGFAFEEKIVGGAVPRSYIPSVEIGVRDYLTHGPLGFPVVDLSVTLTDGSFHAVDSSDMAFRQAGRIAMSEGLPNCEPVLLEPIMSLAIAIPNEATARITGLISQHRGQILRFEPRESWPGWDIVHAKLPESEMDTLIIELRSATQGVGTYTGCFDHMAELSGKLADQVLSAHKQAAE